VFWLLIGTNDIGKTWCSPELVVIGILRIVEEIRRRKPASTVVINGLLPRTFDFEGGFVNNGRNQKPALWQDIKAINDELQQYAARRDKVEYFESSVFLVDKDADEDFLKIDSDLMPDFLHPNAPGYRLWGEEIVATLGRLLPHK
jgi:lysophospholipase L1-like esterase